MVTAIRAELKKALTDLSECKKKLKEHEEIPLSEDKSVVLEEVPTSEKEDLELEVSSLRSRLEQTQKALQEKEKAFITLQNDLGKTLAEQAKGDLIPAEKIELNGLRQKVIELEELAALAPSRRELQKFKEKTNKVTALNTDLQNANFKFEAKNQNLKVMLDEALKDYQAAAEARDQCRTEFNEFKLQVKEKIQELEKVS